MSDRAELLKLHDWDELLFGGFYCLHCTPDDEGSFDDPIAWPCPPLREAGLTDDEAREIIASHREKVEAEYQAQKDAERAKAQGQVDQHNARYPVGTLVFAYPGCRPEDGAGTRLVTRTRTEAQLSASGDPVVWVEGEGSYISLTHVDPVSEDVWEEARAAEKAAAAAAKPSGPRHATRAETVPALMATIKELRASRQPLIDALTLVHKSMTSCVGDEWAMEWLGEVWTQIPLNVRAAAGDKDAAAELAEASA